MSSAMVRAIGALATTVALAVACGNEDSNETSSGLSSQAEAGRAAYEATCASCHGEDLRGTSTGPPFLDVIYAPNHHPDDSFRAAVARGVQSHHWNFGPMPPQPPISDDKIDTIIAYVRVRQAEAGITEDPSH